MTKDEKRIEEINQEMNTELMKEGAKIEGSIDARFKRYKKLSPGTKAIFKEMFLELLVETRDKTIDVCVLYHLKFMKMSAPIQSEILREALLKSMQDLTLLQNTLTKENTKN